MKIVDKEGRKTNLWNNCNLVSKIVQTDELDVNTIDVDSASAVFEYSEESERETGLASASSADNANLLAGSDIEREALENVV